MFVPAINSTTLSVLYFILLCQFEEADLGEVLLDNIKVFFIFINFLLYICIYYNRTGSAWQCSDRII